MASDVFKTLGRYGINASDIARCFGVSRNTSSRWSRGVRSVSHGVERDLWELAALASEYKAQGREPKEALEHWRPTIQFTRWKQDNYVETNGGGAGIDIPKDLEKDLSDSASAKAAMEIMLRAASRQVGRIESEWKPSTMQSRMELRRALQVAEVVLTALNRQEAVSGGEA